MNAEFSVETPESELLEMLSLSDTEDRIVSYNSFWVMVIFPVIIFESRSKIIKAIQAKATIMTKAACPKYTNRTNFSRSSS